MLSCSLCCVMRTHKVSGRSRNYDFQKKEHLALPRYVQAKSEHMRNTRKCARAQKFINLKISFLLLWKSALMLSIRYRTSINFVFLWLHFQIFLPSTRVKCGGESKKMKFIFWVEDLLEAGAIKNSLYCMCAAARVTYFLESLNIFLHI